MDFQNNHVLLKRYQYYRIRMEELTQQINGLRFYQILKKKDLKKLKIKIRNDFKSLEEIVFN